MFGNTLTKHRARLAMRTMTDQAELRLFLRDEHLKQEAERKRAKRQTTSHGVTAPPRPQPQSTPSASTSALPSSETHAATGLSAPPVATVTDGSPDTVDDEIEDGNVDSTRETTSRRLNTVFANMTRASEEMEAEDLDPAAPPPTSVKVLLKNLFDFSNAYWVRADARISKRSLDNELELYQLLDLDAEGDLDDFDAADNLSHPDMIL